MLDIISSVFKQIYKGTFLCEPCFIQELQHHAFSISNMLIHIYSHHRDLWDVHIFQVSSLSHHAWYKLFKFSGCSLVRCKTCHRVFLNARLEDLHYHTRTHHGILLLALSLSHLNQVSNNFMLLVWFLCFVICLFSVYYSQKKSDFSRKQIGILYFFV